MRIRRLIGTFLPVLTLTAVAVGSGAGAEAVRARHSAVSALGAGAAAGSAAYARDVDGSSAGSSAGSPAESPAESPSDPEGSIPWVDDPTPHQGRMIPSSLPLPLREPGLSPLQAAQILRLALAVPGASAQTDPPGTPTPADDGLGFSPAHAYAGVQAGPDASVRVDRADGDALVTLAAARVPGRGVSSFVRLTYNSLAPTPSPIGPGWSLDAATLVPVGQYLRALPEPQQGSSTASPDPGPASAPDRAAVPDPDPAAVPALGPAAAPALAHIGPPIGPSMPTRVALVDGSGAGHVFVLAKHGSPDPVAWDYQASAGVHLYLQRTGSADPGRAWVLTRPDRTQFFFGLNGVATSIVDRVGNMLTYQYGPGRSPAATTLDYRSSLGGHVADLIGQTSPEGRRWTFGVDAYGEPVSVTDPLGNAPGPQHGEFRVLRYDRFGELVASVDEAGRTTRYADFTAAGLPQTTTDPFGTVTRTRYDALGDVTSTEAPTGPGGSPRLSTYTYDALGRPLTSTVTVGATPAEVTPAPVYDADDDVLRRDDPSQGTMYSRYDAMSRLLSQTDPIRPDSSHADSSHADSSQADSSQADAGTAANALPQTTYTYDPAGNLVTETAPLGNTPTGAGGYVTRYRYDAVGRLTQTTDALGGRATVRYDAVGDAVEQIGPRGNASADPAAWARTTVYDLDHRPVRVTEDSGAYTVTHYDLDGLITDGTAQPVDASVPDTDAGLRPYLTHTTRDADGRAVQSDPPRDDESETAIEPEPDGEW